MQPREALVKRIMLYPKCGKKKEKNYFHNRLSLRQIDNHCINFFRWLFY